jgi:predicted ATPase
VGRASELGEVLSRFDDGARLVTLTGPGGSGKTRLALEAATTLVPDVKAGVFWVGLATLRDPALVLETVGQTLGAKGELAAHVGEREILLLLDSLEQVIDAAPALSEVLRACPNLRLLVTSRELLRVDGEVEYAVPPLAEPEAVTLFCERARTESSAEIRELCARLDNLPLAVELAAARTPALPPAALLDRLTSRLDVLAGPRDADERQRTLRATIAWSYDLLEESEKRLFRRLGVFVGGASLPAIEAVCDADLADVLSVVSKSLLRQASGEGDEPRYFMLETIRELAVGELAVSGELEGLRDRHLEWYAAALPKPLTEELESLQGERLARLELDLANLRSAFGWSAERPSHVLHAVVLAAVLWQRHFMRGRYAEAEDVALRALELDLGALDAALFHDRVGVVQRLRGRPTEALDSYLAGVRVLEGVVDRDPAWWERWISLKLDQAHFFYFENDQTGHGAVIDELEAAVATHGSAAQRLDLMHARLQFRYRLERYALSEETEELARRVYALDRAAGAVSSEFPLGFCLLWRGKLDEAETHLERGLEDARRAGIALYEVRCLVYGLLAQRRRNDVESARARLADLESLDELHGYRGLISACSAWIAYRDNEPDDVVRYGEEALGEWRSEGRLGYGVFQWTARFPLLGAALATGDVDSAVGHVRAMLDPHQQALPAEVAAAVERAAATGRPEDLQAALDVARPHGYS